MPNGAGAYRAAAGRDMADSAARPDFVAADLVEAAEIIVRTNAPCAAAGVGALAMLPERRSVGLV